MGKTSKPTVWVVQPSLMDLVQVRGLAEQGHTILSMAEIELADIATTTDWLSGLKLSDVDIIIGSNCQWFTDTMEYRIDAVLKAARERATARAKRKD